ncbi:hypothetical protein [Neorickettsia helminthoeca]|uniref:hypothetical protein n=1 Tax=Neorickettsia helminthoeca TaxID=33994 RepID=UPI00057205A0|nr:hypothetical protein [Neorickettsia helminthoeca]
MIEGALLSLISDLDAHSQLTLPVITKQCVDCKKRYSPDSFAPNSARMRLYDLIHRDSSTQQNNLSEEEQNHEDK